MLFSPIAGALAFSAQTNLAAAHASVRTVMQTGRIGQWRRFLYRKDSHHGMTGLVAGPDGNIWFTDSVRDVLVSVHPDGTMQSFPLAVTVGEQSQPFSPGVVAVGADGRFYMGGCLGSGQQQACNEIGVADTKGAFAAVAIPSGLGPGLYGGLTLAPDGSVWFRDGDNVGAISPSGTIAEYSIPTSRLASQNGIAAAGGKIWLSYVDSFGGGRPTIVAFDPSTRRSTSYSIGMFCTNLLGLSRDGAAGIFVGCENADYPVFAQYELVHIGPDGRQDIYADVTGQDGISDSLATGRGGRIWFSSASGFSAPIVSPVLVAFDSRRGAYSAVAPPFTLAAPISVTLGPGGNVWLLDNGNPGYVPSSIVEYTGDASTSQAHITDGRGPLRYWKRFRSQAHGLGSGSIVPGPDGASLWYTDAAQPFLRRMSLGGTVTSFSLAVPRGGGHTAAFLPGKIAVGADGNFYIGGCLRTKSVCTTGYIGVATPSGAFTVTATPSGDGPGTTNGLALGPDRNVWLVEGAHVASISPARVVTEFAYPPGTTNNTNAGITVGPDADMWFTEASSYVANINPHSGAISEYAGGCGDDGIVSAGAVLYIACKYAGGEGVLAVVAPSGAFTPLANPDGLTSWPIRGPDGNPWFVSGTFGYSPARPLIEEYDPRSRVFTAYPLPEFFGGGPRGLVLLGIALGPDGNIWALDRAGFLDVYVVNGGAHPLAARQG